MEIQLFVQKKGELNPTELVLYTDKTSKAKLAIIYSSIKDDNKLKEYFTHLTKNLKTPFIAVRVSGTITPKEGYQEDAVAMALLTGDIKAKTVHTKINILNPEQTVNELIPLIEEGETYLVYTANYIKNLNVTDAILRRVQNRYPLKKIYGGGSSPNPMVATNGGVFTDHLICASITGMKPCLDLFSGFSFNKKSAEELVISKSKELLIQEINGKKAGEEYSRIQHIRPYFFNMLATLTISPELPKVCKALAKTNKSLYEGILRFSVDFFGYETDNNIVEPLAVYEINEEENGLCVGNYKPKGTVLKRLSVSKEKQLKVYDEINKKIQETNFMLINSCSHNLFWIDFDLKSLEKKLSCFSHPYLIGFFFGEFKTPEKEINPDINITHNCVVDVLYLPKK